MERQEELDHLISEGRRLRNRGELDQGRRVLVQALALLFGV